MDRWLPWPASQVPGIYRRGTLVCCSPSPFFGKFASSTGGIPPRDLDACFLTRQLENQNLHIIRLRAKIKKQTSRRREARRHQRGRRGTNRLLMPCAVGGCRGGVPLTQATPELKSRFCSAGNASGFYFCDGSARKRNTNAQTAGCLLTIGTDAVGTGTGLLPVTMWYPCCCLDGWRGVGGGLRCGGGEEKASEIVM